MKSLDSLLFNLSSYTFLRCYLFENKKRSKSVFRSKKISSIIFLNSINMHVYLCIINMGLHGIYCTYVYKFTYNIFAFRLSKKLANFITFIYLLLKKSLTIVTIYHISLSSFLIHWLLSLDFSLKDIVLSFKNYA